MITRKNARTLIKGETVLELTGVTREFVQGEVKLKILNGVSLKVSEGEVLSIVGPSGCGKSTLLQIAGLLEHPTKGRVTVAGEDMTKARDSVRTAMRRSSLGFVYQFHHLLAEFLALENVVLPQMIAGTSRRKAKKKAEELLGQVGLAERIHHRPTQLSGGEQQRVALARALANDPKILLADEPTGNLDPATAADMFSVLMLQVRSKNLALIMVTHDRNLASQSDRVLTLEKGKLKEL